VETTGTCDDAFGFVNPDGPIILMLRNQLPQLQMIQVQANDRVVAFELPPGSVGTLASKPG
jgi:glucosylceramidase